MSLVIGVSYEARVVFVASEELDDIVNGALHLLFGRLLRLRVLLLLLFCLLGFVGFLSIVSNRVEEFDFARFTLFLFREW